MVRRTLFFLFMFCSLISGAWAEGRTIVVVNGNRRIEFELNETSAADSLWDQLPFNASVENYGSNEKIFTPPEKLDTGNAQEGDCPAGTLAYFSPWGNLVMYYGPAPRYSGLYILGHATLNSGDIGNLSGTIELTKKEERKQQEGKQEENSSSTGNASSGGGSGCNSLGRLTIPLGLLLWQNKSSNRTLFSKIKYLSNTEVTDNEENF